MIRARSIPACTAHAITRQVVQSRLWNRCGETRRSQVPAMLAAISRQSIIAASRSGGALIRPATPPILARVDV
jgi:hypothetical protein